MTDLRRGAMRRATLLAEEARMAKAEGKPDVAAWLEHRATQYLFGHAPTPQDSSAPTSA